MTDLNELEDQLKLWIERSIRDAIEGVAAAPHARLTEDSARSKLFLTKLGGQLEAAAAAASHGLAHLVRAFYLDKSGLGGGPNKEFLWDIFVGRYGTDEERSREVLTHGIWAVESELHRGYQVDFNKLVVANVEHRLFVLPSGRRQLSALQSQSEVANVACWFAEVSPLADWRTGPDFMPVVKLKHTAARR
jgi:hypothetical protein